MKNIKTLFLLALGVGIASQVNAQEAKAEPGKPVQTQFPSTADNRPSPVILKPQAGAQPTSVVATTPSPKNRDEEQRPEQAPKTATLTIDKDLSTRNLTPEQIRTSNGKSDKPKAVIITQPAPKEQ